MTPKGAMELVNKILVLKNKLAELQKAVMSYCINDAPSTLMLPLLLGWTELVPPMTPEGAMEFDNTGLKFEEKIC